MESPKVRPRIVACNCEASHIGSAMKFLVVILKCSVEKWFLLVQAADGSSWRIG
jgi:hypothetical protein